MWTLWRGERRKRNYVDVVERGKEEEELCEHCGEGKGGRGIVWTL